MLCNFPKTNFKTSTKLEKNSLSAKKKIMKDKKIQELIALHSEIFYE